MRITRMSLLTLMFLIGPLIGYRQDVKPALALSFDDGQGKSPVTCLKTGLMAR